jgi:CubicO group peptidase (beta-lactamase class C family)
MGKLIQCVSGEYPWDIFRREITEKLGVEYHIRLSDKELQLHGPDFETEHFVKDAKIPPDVMSRFLAGMEDPQKAQQSLSPSERKDVPYQLSAGNARGGAKLFAFAAMGGELNGVRVLSPRTIELMTQVQWHEKCAVWGTPMRTALGLLLNNDFFYVGPNLDAFGTAGAGGSFAFADPENQLSMGYSVNRWWPALALGDRARSLVDAAYVSL